MADVERISLVLKTTISRAVNIEVVVDKVALVYGCWGISVFPAMAWKLPTAASEVWYTLRRPEPRKNLGLVNVFIQNGNFPLL
jgi:hypothetical protein